MAAGVTPVQGFTFLLDSLLAEGRTYGVEPYAVGVSIAIIRIATENARRIHGEMEVVVVRLGLTSPEDMDLAALVDCAFGAVLVAWPRDRASIARAIGTGGAGTPRGAARTPARDEPRPPDRKEVARATAPPEQILATNGRMRRRG